MTISRSLIFLINADFSYLSAICPAKAENRKKDICFEITIEDMANQFEIQNGKCIYTGLDLDFGKTQRDG